MITKKFLRRRGVATRETRKALRMCEAYISVRLEKQWSPGHEVHINVLTDLLPLLTRQPKIALFYELVERLSEAGWVVGHNLGPTKNPGTVFFLIS